MSLSPERPLQPESAGLPDALQDLSAEQLDELEFGVIRFGPDFLVDRYNLAEMQFTGLRREQALGLHVFTQLAQCMNNWLVAQRYEDSLASGDPLDVRIDYTLTWRMRPTPVRLRLIRGAGRDASSFIVVQRVG